MTGDLLRLHDAGSYDFCFKHEADGSLSLASWDGVFLSLPAALLPVLAAWLDGEDVEEVEGFRLSDFHGDHTFTGSEGEIRISERLLDWTEPDDKGDILFTERPRGGFGIENGNGAPFRQFFDATHRKELSDWLKARIALRQIPEGNLNDGVYLITDGHNHVLSAAERRGERWFEIGSDDDEGRTLPELLRRFGQPILPMRADRLLRAYGVEWTKRASADGSATLLYANGVFAGSIVQRKVTLSVDLETDGKTTGERWMARGSKLPPLRPNTGYATKDEAMAALKEAWLDRKKTK